MRLVAIALALSACTTPDVVDYSAAEQPLVHLDCSVPGAVPDDGLDDAPAVQDALDEQGCARLGPGVYDLDDPAGQIAVLSLTGGMMLECAGPATTLHYRGSPGGDWRGVRMTGADNTLERCSIDTTDLVAGDEQTHAIEVLGNATFGPASGNAIREMLVIHPHVQGQPRGDCVRLLGEAAYQVTRTTVADNVLQCRRSAIAVQRGVFGATITGNLITDTTDQAIDGEQSGGGTEGPRNGQISIVGNIIDDPGKFAIAMSGRETRGLVIADNVINGGGLRCVNCPELVITSNVILHPAPGSADATVQLVGETSATIADNAIVRGAGTAGPVIGVSNDWRAEGGVQTPLVSDRTRVVGNSLSQGTAFVGVNVLSATSTTISDNTITLAGGLTAPHAIKLSRNGAADPLTEGAAVVDNILRGAWDIGVTLQATVGANVHGNSLDAGPGAKGLSCAASSSLIVSYGNRWSASSCAAATAGGI